MQRVHCLCPESLRHFPAWCIIKLRLLCLLANLVSTIFCSVAGGQSWDTGGMKGRGPKKGTPTFLRNSQESLPEDAWPHLDLCILSAAASQHFPVPGWSWGANRAGAWSRSIRIPKNSGLENSGLQLTRHSSQLEKGVLCSLGRGPQFPSKPQSKASASPKPPGWGEKTRDCSYPDHPSIPNLERPGKLGAAHLCQGLWSSWRKRVGKVRGSGRACRS